MSTVKRQSSELRDEYAALTRGRIVAAFVESLADGAGDDVSMADVAKRAKVAERTIYRHFKTRAELLAAAGEWIENNVFGYVPFTSPDELPGIFRKLCRSFDRHPHLARAIALTRAGRTMRADFRRRLIEHHRKAMAPLTRHLKPKEARQAEALATYLNNVLAWSALREDFGMSSAEIADAIEWALTTLLKDVRRRDAAAARLSSDKDSQSKRKRTAAAKPPA
ncbi:MULTISPECIES: TetR/AcrR family transcriptional regulator [unclassified Bradyrhizobium]|uniref:TetR/AcrR family transcriptional regulator n=1 Tax=unclassified Bradyrhizobium TaxID=2631580 RepID=UPI001BAD98B2|nr:MULTISPECIES: TetR/AcrR family transcriptional regulator [unclassified Bradyrhizobium]MBR1224826.1 TetR/AcrR family transcriptional regulator [Bradyrhizobium sp. AUGA SZCCT0176]MBR1236495.1 TetR/AcrR family transcriptional regulator [Bradyrhizobium sp. AUGA SZCCT0182]MBR1300022.1 TetR/AcrR family transcriptional regulator [Bradyrhizobium sp. AUGA SZCCT0042]